MFLLFSKVYLELCFWRKWRKKAEQRRETKGKRHKMTRISLRTDSCCGYCFFASCSPAGFHFLLLWLYSMNDKTRRFSLFAIKVKGVIPLGPNGHSIWGGWVQKSLFISLIPLWTRKSQTEIAIDGMNARGRKNPKQRSRGNERS